MFSLHDEQLFRKNFPELWNNVFTGQTPPLPHQSLRLSSTTTLTTTATVRSITQRAAGGPTSLTSWRRTRKTFTQRCSWRRAAGAASTPTTLSRYTPTRLAAVEARLLHEEEGGQTDVGEIVGGAVEGKVCVSDKFYLRFTSGSPLTQFLLL